MSATPTQSEAELVDHAIVLLREMFSKQSPWYTMEREVGVGRTIADVVLLIVADPDSCVRLHPLNVTESVVLASLRRRGPTRIDLLERRCGVPHLAFRNGALKRLRKCGALEFGAGGRVALTTPSTEQCSIIAFEAKLVKWRHALKQATQYRQYADEAYVLLPEEHATRALSASREFRAAGVGLFIVSTSGLHSAVQAKRHTQHTWKREFVYSRLAPRNRSLP